MLRAEDQGLVTGYAEALYALAKSENAEDKLQEELFELKKALDNSYELKEFLGNRGVTAEVKLAAVKELISPSAGRMVTAALNAVIENGRAHLTEDIIDAYLEMMKLKKKRVIAEVTTAVALNDDLRAKIAGRLSEATGFNVVVSSTVDKSVLGGMMVKQEGKILDASTKKKLEDIKNVIETAG